MVSKLPRWVEYGSFTLAFVAGLINSIGLLGFKHQSISHLSGTATLLGSSLASSPFSETYYLVFILLSFLFGAAIPGYFLRSGALRLGRNYSVLLIVEALFLCLAVYFLTGDSLNGHYWASAACGLQNALATTYSGAVIRTTHVTGIFTDLGIMIGARLRGDRFDKRKATLLSLIILGFILGGSAGAFLFSAFRFNALFIPAAICVLLALMYAIYSTNSARMRDKL